MWGGLTCPAHAVCRQGISEVKGLWESGCLPTCLFLPALVITPPSVHNVTGAQVYLSCEEGCYPPSCHVEGRYLYPELLYFMCVYVMAEAESINIFKCACVCVYLLCELEDYKKICFILLPPDL